MGTRAGILKQPLNSKAKSDNTRLRLISEGKAVKLTRTNFWHIVQHSAIVETIAGNVSSVWN